MFVCISKTDVDWQTLLPNAQKALGRSVSASLDTARLPIVGAASLICAVSEFSTCGNVMNQLRTDGLARKHAWYGFLVNLPREYFLTLASYGLAVTAAEVGDYAIVSGSFYEWVQAVVDGTNRKELRKFFCLLHAWFERENLGEAWSMWGKKHLPDFYCLELK